MGTDDIIALKPFVPAKDFELATRFYQDLGLTEVRSTRVCIRLSTHIYNN